MPGINLAFELETEAEAAARVARERLFTPPTTSAVGATGASSVGLPAAAGALFQGAQIPPPPPPPVPDMRWAAQAQAQQLPERQPRKWR
jgi:hypothetical protein